MPKPPLHSSTPTSGLTAHLVVIIQGLTFLTYAVVGLQAGLLSMYTVVEGAKAGKEALMNHLWLVAFNVLFAALPWALLLVIPLTNSDKAALVMAKRIEDAEATGARAGSFYVQVPWHLDRFQSWMTDLTYRRTDLAISGGFRRAGDAQKNGNGACVYALVWVQNVKPANLAEAREFVPKFYDSEKDLPPLEKTGASDSE